MLIVFGIATFGYTGFTYSSREKLAQIGDVQITANTEKTVFVPPLVSGLSLIVGIGLVMIGRMGKSQ